MALVFPSNAENYSLLFKELAKAHVNIRHDETPDRQNFCVINLNSGMRGFSDTDIRNFLSSSKQKTQSKNTEDELKCQMILFRMETSGNKDSIKINRLMATGSFAIMSKPSLETPDKIDEAYNNCYNVGFEIFGAFKSLFSQNVIKGTIEDLETEAIRVDKSVGYRFDFSWMIATGVCYNESKFNNITIEEL